MSIIILEPYVDNDSWSYIKNQNGNCMRLTLEGYGSCTPVWKLVEFIDNLTQEQKQDLSDRIDASQTKGGSSQMDSNIKPSSKTDENEPQTKGKKDE